MSLRTNLKLAPLILCAITITHVSIFLKFIQERQDLPSKNLEAIADVTCQNPPSRATTSTIPDSHLVYRWYKGTWFKMPIGFRNPWRGYLGCVPTREAYEFNLRSSEGWGYDATTGKYNPLLDTKPAPLVDNFAFCMPSMSYFERHYYIYGNGRVKGVGPCEDKTRAASETDYPVTFRIREPFVEGVENSSNALPFLNNMKSFKEKGFYISQNVPRAEHNQNGPISGEKDYYIYSDDSDLAVLFMCNINTFLCDGKVWAKSRQLLFDITLPFDRVQINEDVLWVEPVHKVIELIEDWRE